MSSGQKMTTVTIDKHALGKTLVKAAWLSVALGLGIEFLLLTAAAFFKNSGETGAIVAETVQKITWSTLVCTGVAVGLAAAKMRPQIMGLAGLVSGPVAFYIAKIAHKSVSQALSIAAQAPVAGPSPFLLASIKGVEYAVLGFLIGQLGKRTNVELKGHLAAGAATGIVFGGGIVYLMVSKATEPISTLSLVTRCINEIIFPVGCSLVLFAAQKIGEKQHDVERPETDTVEAMVESKE